MLNTHKQTGNLKNIWTAAAFVALLALLLVNYHYVQAAKGGHEDWRGIVTSRPTDGMTGS